MVEEGLWVVRDETASMRRVRTVLPRGIDTSWESIVLTSCSMSLFVSLAISSALQRPTTSTLPPALGLGRSKLLRLPKTSVSTLRLLPKSSLATCLLLRCRLADDAPGRSGMGRGEGRRAGEKLGLPKCWEGRTQERIGRGKRQEGRKMEEEGEGRWVHVEGRKMKGRLWEGRALRSGHESREVEKRREQKKAEEVVELARRTRY